MIGRRRVEEVGILTFTEHVAWMGIRPADARCAAWLGHLIWRLRDRDGCGGQQAAGGGSGQDIPTRELTHDFSPFWRISPAGVGSRCLNGSAMVVSFRSAARK